MKTTTKLLLAGGATIAVGAYAYRMGVNHVQFSLDGYQLAPDGAGLLMRIKATNPNKFFGYPVPQALIHVFDNNSNFLVTAINQQLQYIPANTTSFIYAVVQPNYQNLISIVTGIITSGALPTNLIFNGLVKVGPVQIPFDTGASIGSVSFDSNGLRYPVAYLSSMKKKIAFLPIEEQAKFVDAVTYENCNNPDFIKQAKADLSSANFESINATSIGNAAYMALHCSDEQVKINMLSFLEAYKKYVS